MPCRNVCYHYYYHKITVVIIRRRGYVPESVDNLVAYGTDVLRAHQQDNRDQTLKCLQNKQRMARTVQQVKYSRQVLYHKVHKLHQRDIFPKSNRFK